MDFIRGGYIYWIDSKEPIKHKNGSLVPVYRQRMEYVSKEQRKEISEINKKVKQEKIDNQFKKFEGVAMMPKVN